MGNLNCSISDQILKSREHTFQMDSKIVKTADKFTQTFNRKLKRCRKCKRIGHRLRNCWYTRCFNCHQLGHIAKYCHLRTRLPRSLPITRNNCISLPRQNDNSHPRQEGHSHPDYPARRAQAVQLENPEIDNLNKLFENMKITDFMNGTH